ncbi:MAG: sulfur transferase domain-containing protein [Planctomycetota bacterium]
MPRHRFAVSVLAAVLAAACSSAPPTKPAEVGLTNFAAPLPHVFSSGQPSPTQFAQLAAVGITRVVCLRPTTEPGTGFEEAAAPGLGLHFVRVPVGGKDGLTRANVDRLAKELADAGDGNTLVYCHSSNRVGALLALKAAWLDGKPPKEAIDLGKRAGLTKLEPAVAEQLAK